MRLGLLFFTTPLPANLQFFSRRRDQSSSPALAYMISSDDPGANPQIFKSTKGQCGGES